MIDTSRNFVSNRICSIRFHSHSVKWTVKNLFFKLGPRWETASFLFLAAVLSVPKPMTHFDSRVFTFSSHYLEIRNVKMGCRVGEDFFPICKWKNTTVAAFRLVKHENFNIIHQQFKLKSVYPGKVESIRQNLNKRQTLLDKLSLNEAPTSRSCHGNGELISSLDGKYSIS